MEKHRLEIRKESASYKKDMQAMHVTTGDANTRAAARWRGKLGPAEAADVSSLLDAILQHHTTNKKLREVEDFTKRGRSRVSTARRRRRCSRASRTRCATRRSSPPSVARSSTPVAQRWADGVIEGAAERDHKVRVMTSGA